MIADEQHRRIPTGHPGHDDIKTKNTGDDAVIETRQMTGKTQAERDSDNLHRQQYRGQGEKRGQPQHRQKGGALGNQGYLEPRRSRS